TALVSPSPAQSQSLDTEMSTLDDEIVRSKHAYEGLAHDRSEMQIYQEFETNWRAYRAGADRVFELARAESKAEAVALYLSSSHRLFVSASDSLGRLSDLTNENAQTASDRAAAAIKTAWNFLSAAVILSVLVVGVILLYVTGVVIRPLKELSSCMQALSRGDMDVEIPKVDRRNELGEMARSVAVFKNNAVELKLSQLGLASQAKMLEEKLAHEIRLNQQQRNFISMASHEFRTPMTIIDGHAQRLINAQEPATHSKIAERAKKIRSAIKRMSAMIDANLQTARFIDEEHSLYLHVSDFDIRAVAHEVCKLHREISMNAVIVENLGSEPLKVSGDKDLLLQVLNNLVANAVKYSPAGGEVRVECRGEGGDVLVSVKDNGIGVPQSELPHVFERYYRCSNATSIVGTGIGLFFVRLVVDLHGGTVSAESDGKSGSTFAVRLGKRTEAV
ncbi:MAG TPA: ATP-binding protein, partial [Methylocystis sp.]|nr:ATP-binding protein [Methylocystis sp.]